MTKLPKKTILGKSILKWEFYKMQIPRLYKKGIFGYISLEGGERIKCENGKYFILNERAERSGQILKTNPAYKLIKRLIARWFTTYRNGNRGGQMHHVGYWKSRVIDGLHNCSLFRNSNISFKKNQTNFLKLAS
ncbi:hypothetical protein SAMN05421866_4182 [Chryseobacterium oranimense]|uniref:Uncharacterized protein n=1 Tax=Chryseobacterium oranimense TaxID=421058 RepID=A0A1M5WRT8_9FLAO|nr:hypothetical protein [Chryseobacterium oranimense]SHH89733.1 hypothetical protein SAMN05421866_4182 [Chryseobacterium oranimense]